MWKLTAVVMNHSSILKHWKTIAWVEQRKYTFTVAEWHTPTFFNCLFIFLQHIAVFNNSFEWIFASIKRAPHRINGSQLKGYIWRHISELKRNEQNKSWLPFNITTMIFSFKFGSKYAAYMNYLKLKENNNSYSILWKGGHIEYMHSS